MNQKLGSIARQEILKAMTGLGGTAAKAEAVRLADDLNVDVKHIYRMTVDVRKGNRKKRSDAGKRTFELVEGTDVWYAAQLVISDKLDPDLALLTAKTRGHAHLPSLEHFRKLLAENGLGKKARRTPRIAVRRFEASLPGEMFQIDVTALKVRWQDEKSRRILKIEGVDKNHPQMDPTKVQVWQILLKDDHSRLVFLRYFVARAITSREMVRFMSEAYSELGVPLKLYTDQGGEFKGRHKDAIRILNALPTIKETGGYTHMPHLPNNAKATGKVENGHQWAEKLDKLVGVAVTEGRDVTLETLNFFAARICASYNNREHRTTHQTPMFRWHNTRTLIRKFDRSVIESALLSEEFVVPIDPAMTITVGKQQYRLPSVWSGTTEKAPFVDYIGQKVRVVVPENIDTIILTLPGPNGKFEPIRGESFDIDKVLATTSAAGEFRGVADTNAQDLTKRLKATRKADVQEIKAKGKLTGQIAPIPHLDVEIEQPATNVTAFPQPERIASREEIAAVVPIPQAPATGKSITYWQAVVDYADRFEGGIDEAKAFLLGPFPGTAGELPAADVETAIERRHEVQRPRLQAVS